MYSHYKTLVAIILRQLNLFNFLFSTLTLFLLHSESVIYIYESMYKRILLPVYAISLLVCEN